MYCTSELDAEIEWKCDIDLPLCQVLHKVLQVCQTSAGLKNPPGKCNIGNVDKFLPVFPPTYTLMCEEQSDEAPERSEERERPETSAKREFSDRGSERQRTAILIVAKHWILYFGHSFLLFTNTPKGVFDSSFLYII